MNPRRDQHHPEALDRLLSGQISEAEQAAITAHLEGCGECRKALDGLAARSGLWSDLALLRDEELDPPTCDLGKDRAFEPGDEEEVPIGLFEPASEPGLPGRLGPYDILRLIGRGGMGMVFLA